MLEIVMRLIYNFWHHFRAFSFRQFTKQDAFVGFHEDSVPAVVLQVCSELLDDGSKLSEEERESWEEKVSIAGLRGLIFESALYMTTPVLTKKNLK